MGKGRPVYQGKDKMAALAVQLFRTQRIASPTIDKLADFCGIGRPALKRAMSEERFSPEMEEKIRVATGMDPTSIAWVDVEISATDRDSDPSPEYPGRDTISAFQGYLLSIMPLKSPTRGDAQSDEMPGEKPWAADKNLACHEIRLAQASNPSQLGLHLQSDFGWRYQEKIKYVLRKVRLDVAIGCAYGSATERLGRNEPKLVGTIMLRGRGTDQQPFWDISPANDGPTLPEGSHEITEPPLAIFRDLRPGAQIASRMQVNVHDGDIIPDDGIQPLTGAQSTLIERAFTLEFGLEEQESGWLTLSRHDVTISGGG